MAFAKEVKLENSEFTYTLGADVKRFLLKDVGFEETKAGNFKLVRAIKPLPTSKEDFKLEIMVEGDLSGFRMKVTTPNGLKTVDIFDGNHEMVADKFYFMMDGFIERGVFAKN
ncbi:MAG: DUF1831 domain-containing protein [Lactobacillales bacterium]|jgi:hypothetical protein|nr:DUF1831 domain-containing protein [Lactobacillales bacterium]